MDNNIDERFAIIESDDGEKYDCYSCKFFDPNSFDPDKVGCDNMYALYCDPESLVVTYFKSYKTQTLEEADRIYESDWVDDGRKKKLALNNSHVCYCSEYERWEPNYYQYLDSNRWKKKREQVLKAANFKCSVCGSAKNLCVHHITYENLGYENDDDLMVVCKKCHERIHENDLKKKPQKGEQQ